MGYALAEYGTRVLERQPAVYWTGKRDYFRYSLSPDRWKGTNLSVIWIGNRRTFTGRSFEEEPRQRSSDEEYFCRTAQRWYLFPEWRAGYPEVRIAGTAENNCVIVKLAEIELVKQMIKDTPVLLLDDVLSELDKSRQNYLLDSIPDIQTVVTCTGLDEICES